MISAWLFDIYTNGVLKEVKTICGRMGMKLYKNGKEWTLVVLVYADDLVLIGESESDLWMIIECFESECMEE